MVGSCSDGWLAKVVLLAAALGGVSACGRPEKAMAPAVVPAGMEWIPGGEFTMGSEGQYALRNEGPAHAVRVRAFFMDAHAVTNAQFAAFVEATGYVTMAERAVDWEEMRAQLPPGTPRPSDEELAPGSLVFTPSDGPVDLRNLSRWWRWVPGANWRRPEGPGSSIAERMDHPVVQVAWDDAQAYAAWAGKRLPTEAEWEFAARGGLVQARFAWGDAPLENAAGGQPAANTWTGDFPWRNTAADGFVGTSPVKAFPPNAYGLYDMAGNVWNWCSDIYRHDTFTRRAWEPELCSNPVGPADSRDEPLVPWDPSPPTVAGAVRRVTKGGSYLCHEAYCESFRPAARRGTPPDTGSAHVGFRCVRDV